MDSTHSILIVGGGPTGLGAALRLVELGYESWSLLDKSGGPGGLSSTFVDGKGFTWDIGGHVIFSHYQYFDDLMDAAFVGRDSDSDDDGWNRLQRESWVRICGVWAPYPFQLNIHRLPEREMRECLAGLEEVAAQPPSAAARNFEEHICNQFGPGIAEHFMIPYNYKVWAVPPREMSASWMGERVAAVDLPRIKANIAKKEDDVGWGPNATFRYPKRGGTGAIYSSLAERFLPKDRCHYGAGQAAVVGVRPGARTVQLASGEERPYDTLISTMALDELLGMVADGMEAEGAVTPGPDYPFTPARLRGYAALLVSNTTHVIGFGLKGRPQDHSTTCWMYFPGSEAPFYRATVFSNYAAANVPHPGEEWSLMLEVNFNETFKPNTYASEEALVEACLRGCVAAGIMTETDASDHIISAFTHVEKKGYPIPTLELETALAAVQPWLAEKLGILSRGRFGGWRYEVANQDHSLLQGVEAVDATILRHCAAATLLPEGEYPCTRRVPWKGAEVSLFEGEPTYSRPNYVNTTRSLARCTLKSQ